MYRVTIAGTSMPEDIRLIASSGESFNHFDLPMFTTEEASHAHHRKAKSAYQVCLG
jgi:hypothetical protein